MKYFFIVITLSFLFAYNTQAKTIEKIVDGAYSEIRNENNSFK